MLVSSALNVSLAGPGGEFHETPEPTNGPSTKGRSTALDVPYTKPTTAPTWQPDHVAAGSADVTASAAIAGADNIAASTAATNHSRIVMSPPEILPAISIRGGVRFE